MKKWADSVDTQKRANSKLFERAGHRYFYTRLIENGSFKQPDKTPMQSVILSDYNEAVTLLSLENATIKN